MLGEGDDESVEVFMALEATKARLGHEQGARSLARRLLLLTLV